MNEETGVNEKDKQNKAEIKKKNASTAPITSTFRWTICILGH